MAAHRFVAYLPRIGAYSGAVALAAQTERAPAPPPQQRPTAAPQPHVAAPLSPSAGQLAELNKSQLYGPLGSQKVGMFEIG